MLYIKDISTAADTAKKNWQRTHLKVWRGVITEMEVEIPKGHAGLCRCQIFHGGHIIMPTNEDGYVSGDNDTIKGKFFIELPSETNDLFIYTWNLDDTYSHSLTVRVNVLPRFAVLPIGAADGMIKALKSIFLKGV